MNRVPLSELGCAFQVKAGKYPQCAVSARHDEAKMLRIAIQQRKSKHKARGCSCTDLFTPVSNMSPRCVGKHP